ncbi:MAG: DMT family transporter [Desulfovibrionaceae bacterium]|nr:DMT family transporter [Desulfovibrionaceae bacterium]
MSKIVFLYVFIDVLLFSSLEVALKGLVGLQSAMQVNCTRFVIGGLFLLPLALAELRKRKIKLNKIHIRQFFLLGFVGTVFSLSMYQMAVELVPANVVGIIFCCNTIFVVALAHIFMRTPLYSWQIVALTLSSLGIVALIDPFNTTLPANGLILSVAAPIAFALYSVFGGTLARELGGISFTCGSFLAGSLEMLFLIGLGQIDFVAGFFSSYGFGFLAHVNLFQGYNLTTFLLVLYVGIGVSGLGFVCYFLAQEHGSPLIASLAFFFKPILLPILSFIVLGERLNFMMVLGIVLILGASFLIIYKYLEHNKHLEAKFRKRLLKKHTDNLFSKLC